MRDNKSKKINHTGKMPAEILNIAFHTKRLILIALNRFKSHRAAAIELGVSERTLMNLMDEYKIIKVEKWVAKGEENYLKQVSKKQR